jgi:hypothetical protein
MGNIQYAMTTFYVNDSENYSLTAEIFPPNLIRSYPNFAEISSVGRGVGSTVSWK